MAALLGTAVILVLGLTYCLSISVGLGVQETGQYPAPSQVSDSVNGSIQIKECTTSIEPPLKLLCGILTTPRSAGEFQLPFTVIQPPLRSRASDTSFFASSVESTKPPVIYLDGGPGVGGVNSQGSIDFWQMYMQDAGLDRDVIVMALRGTSEATGYYDCDLLREAYRTTLTKHYSMLEEIQVISKNEHECVESYNDYLVRSIPYIGGNEHPGIHLLSSLYQKEDVTLLLRLLGYESWHVWGGSYGGRLALLAGNVPKAHQLKNSTENPKSSSESTRLEAVSIVLDSPYLFSLGGLSSIIDMGPRTHKLHQKVFGHHIHLNDPERASQPDALYPDYSSLMAAALKKTHEKNIHVTVNSDNLDNPITFAITPYRLWGLELLSLYDSGLWHSYYRFLEWVAGTDHKETNFDVNLILSVYASNLLDSNFSMATYYAVECLDNLPSSKSSILDAFDQATNEYRDFLLQHFETEFASTILTRWVTAWHVFEQNYVCSNRLFDGRHPVTRQPYPNIQTAIFSGEMDPVTPAASVETLIKEGELPYQAVTIPNWGHGVLFGYICHANTITALLDAHDRGETIDLNQYCLSE